MPTALLLGLQILAVSFYGTAAIKGWLDVRNPGPYSLHTVQHIGTGALLIHTITLVGLALTQEGHLNLNLAFAASLFLWLLILQFLVADRFLPIRTLGLILFPLAGIVLLVEIFTPTGRSLIIDVSQPVLLGHLALSLLAYGTLTIAAVQAILLAFQETSLRKKRFGRLSRILPSLQPMKRLLFHLIWVGFVILTLVILTGTIFAEQLYDQPVPFNHHVVLSLIAWAVFGLLLIGNSRYGWHVRAAVRWTLSGYGILVLAYFGVRIILEIKT